MDFNDGILLETNFDDKMETIVFFLNSLADGVRKCWRGFGFLFVVILFVVVLLSLPVFISEPSSL